MENKMINHWDYILIILILIITGGHHILRPKHAQNMDIEDPEAELDPSSENLYENSAERDHPTPSTLQEIFVIFNNYNKNININIITSG